MILRTSFVPNDILPLVCMHVQEDHVEVSVSIAHPTYIKNPIQKFYVDSTYYYAALHKRRDNLQRFGKTLLPIGYKMYRRYKHLYQDTGQDIHQLLRLKRQSIIQDLNHFTLHRASPITLRLYSCADKQPLVEKRFPPLHTPPQRRSQTFKRYGIRTSPNGFPKKCFPAPIRILFLKRGKFISRVRHREMLINFCTEHKDHPKIFTRLYPRFHLHFGGTTGNYSMYDYKRGTHQGLISHR